MGTDGPPNAKETKAKLDYLKELLTDRTILASDPHVYIHLGKILEQGTRAYSHCIFLEILRIRSSLFSAYGIYTITDSELPEPEGPKVNLQTKVYMPTDPTNSFNFVGRILGPDGSTAKCLQQCLGVKIMVRGRGSMRDRKKEEANTGKPNWEHLNENLHVVLTVEDFENRAKARLAKASEYINLFLKESMKGSDKDDKVKQMQLMELSFRREPRPSWHFNCNSLLDVTLPPKPGALFPNAAAAANMLSFELEPLAASSGGVHPMLHGSTPNHSQQTKHGGVGSSGSTVNTNGALSGTTKHGLKPRYSQKHASQIAVPQSHAAGSDATVGRSQSRSTMATVKVGTNERNSQKTGGPTTIIPESNGSMKELSKSDTKPEGKSVNRELNGTQNAVVGSPALSTSVKPLSLRSTNSEVEWPKLGTNVRDKSTMDVTSALSSFVPVSSPFPLPDGGTKRYLFYSRSLPVYSSPQNVHILNPDHLADNCTPRVISTDLETLHSYQFYTLYSFTPGRLVISTVSAIPRLRMSTFFKSILCPVSGACLAIAESLTIP
ncbi:hypothetical protein T265_07358 [Opisthorchis viverrini]|uniref:KHDC4/BBP-like KH-domain type I domain-containing protein n=1 Tax=Opisthorchis viverrini TaxID=6198 RepID=A0A074ZCY3_OPIVI|nr:hypothetical protein T265_07358 [Opisthorchis viverrini]KER25136.1 hypothetical protein T265_07358 [Opisthorchis viverrini]